LTVDALLVFSPLQEICFFVLRAPYLDQIGVAPLLRRRLFRFTKIVFFAGFPKYVSSLRPLLLRVALSTLRQPLQLADLRLCPRLSTQASILAKLPTQRRSVLTF